MNNRFVLILVLALCCLGMGKKKPGFSIRFYTETAQDDSDSFAAPVTLLNGKQTYVDQIAVLSEHDILGVYPFVAADGSGGLAMKLDAHGTIGLDTVSVAKRGTLLIAVVNGTQVADIMIDQRVPDGILQIPSGISTDDMKQILKRYPIIGGKKMAKKKDVYSAGFQ
jgi:hypothetical protein